VVKRLGALKALIILGVVFSQTGFALNRQKRVYVLDSEISTVYMQKPYICEEVRRVSRYMSLFSSYSHGANVTEIIGSKINTNKYCVYPIAVFFGRGHEFSPHAFLRALRRIAGDRRAAAVNLSLSGSARYNSELGLYKLLATQGKKIIVAAGNDNEILAKGHCSAYPACYKLSIPSSNFVVVTAKDLPLSNYVLFEHIAAHGAGRGVTGKMSGTSQAAAEITGSLFSN